MDYIIEAAVVTVESLVFSYCLKSYLRGIKTLDALKEVPQLPLDENFEKAVVASNGRIPYAVLRGHIKALATPIRSPNISTAQGVVQKFCLREYSVARTSSGFWVDNSRVINEVTNSVPFAVSSGDVKVEVADALSAKILDLEMISDKFEPVSVSLLENLWEYFRGIKKQGVRHIEEMLQEGTLVTVVGEVVSGDKNSFGSGTKFQIQPPTDGTSFFLTTMPLTSLVRRIQSDVSTSRWLTFGLGIVTVTTFVWVFSKHYRKWAKDRADRQRVEASRRTRRKDARGNEQLPEDKICVVCQTNPKEIILLPCGHVCLCEDCGDKIKKSCPICKSDILSKNPAFIS